MKQFLHRYKILFILLILSNFGLIFLQTDNKGYALTGVGLPGGCPGGEKRYESSYPWSFDLLNNSHLRLIFRLPDKSWCWISAHGRVDTSWAEGGADAWEAVFRQNYYSGSYPDRLELLVPKTFWYPYYIYYRYAMGFSSYDSYRMVANLFWVWAYYL